MKINRVLSEILAEVIEARMKQCYQNSITTLLYLAITCRAKNVRYIEGYLFIMDQFWIEHGWLTLDDEIIDVTLHDTKEEEYSPVYIYEADEAIRLRMKKTPSFSLPLFERDREKRQHFHQQGFMLQERSRSLVLEPEREGAR
jgi:hypothetical protein